MMTDSPTSIPQPRRRVGGIALAMFALMGACGTAWYLSRPAPLPAGIHRSDYERAEQRFQQMYRRPATPREAFSLLGELAVQDEDLQTALVCFRQIPSEDAKYGRSARLQEGQLLVKLNHAIAAEECFTEYLRLTGDADDLPSADRVTACNWLNYLLSVELRFEGRKRHLQQLHDLGQANVFDSKQLYFPYLLIWRSATARRRIAEFLIEDPANPDLLIAHGRYLTAEGKLSEALALLEELCRLHSANRYATAALLECYYERGEDAEFARIAESLPKHEPGEPWLLTRMRGQFALQQGRWQDAVRDFKQVLDADRTNPESQMGLAHAYGQLGQTASRAAALKRSQGLARIRVFLNNVNEEDSQAALDLASLCEEIELNDAARTFRQHAGRISRNQRRAAPNAVFSR